jgi:hypothetical protein
LENRPIKPLPGEETGISLRKIFPRITAIADPEYLHLKFNFFDSAGYIREKHQDRRRDIKMYRTCALAAEDSSIAGDSIIAGTEKTFLSNQQS